MLNGIRHHRAWVFRLLCGGLSELLLCMVLSACSHSKPVANDVSISLAPQGYSYGNDHQENCPIRIQAVGSGLCVYIPDTEPTLCLFREDGVSILEDVMITYKHKPMWSDQTAGFGNGFLYIERHPEKDSETSYPRKAELICYDLSTGAETTLLTTEDAPYLKTAFDEAGNFCISTREMSANGEHRYQTVDGDILLDEMTTQPDPRSGDVFQVLRDYNSITNMLSGSHLEQVLESVEALGIKGICVLYPCAHGWMLFQNGSNVPLWLVAADGTVSPILEVECMHLSSSFNLEGTHAWLSFQRYEKWDDTGYYLQRYENDNLSGTYQINLSDLSITKISDVSYCGIFLFGDDSIITVDQKNGVYQLDKDGTVRNVLISPD